MRPKAHGSKACSRESRGCCDCRAGQQDRAHRVGGADQTRGSQGSGRSHGITTRRTRGVGGRSRSKEDMAQQSARRGRKNQGFPPCHEHAVRDMVPVRELPYGPAASRCITGRTDSSIRLLAKPSRYRLRSKGRPQMESGPFANWRTPANRTAGRTRPMLSSGKVMELSPDAIADRSR